MKRFFDVWLFLVRLNINNNNHDDDEEQCGRIRMIHYENVYLS